MEKVRRITTLILASLLACSALSACAGDPGKNPASDTSAPDTTAPGETTEAVQRREDAKDNLPSDLNFGGAGVGWLCHEQKTREFSVDGGGEERGDIVYDSVYARTRSVEERLGVKFEITMNDASWKDFGTLMETTVRAGDDVWDIIFTKGNASIQSKRDYLFHTVENNKYIDLLQPWWWTPAIEEMSIDGEHIRYLMGDLIIDNMNAARAIYFNKRILDDIGQDEETLYQLAVDRKWTVDELSKLTTAAYGDLNGDGQMNDGDRMGMYISGVGHILAFTFAQEVRHYSRDADNYVYADFDLERAQLCVETLQKYLYETKGTWYTTGKDNRSITNCFNGGSTLFTIAQFQNAFTEAYRSMEDEYGILPLPLLDDTQNEYRTLVTNGGTYATIPVTCKNPDDIGAVLEALCAESYRSVVEPYFEIALKTKYSTDSASGQCMDIIRSAMYKDFLYEYDISNCGQLDYNEIINNTKTLASSYAAKLEQSKTNLQTIYEDFRANLPE